MKKRKLSALLNTPAGAVIAIGMLTIMVELLIMTVIEDVFPISMHKFLYLFDPFLLIAFVSPALYFLFFRPIHRQHTELKDAHKRIGQAFQEWIAAMDAVNDPIFLHDQQFRILRCNKAYQRCAGLPFKQIIGQPYYEVFPKADSPLPSCRRAMEKAEEEAEEEVTAGAAIYRLRAYSIRDEQGAYLYSVHTLEDITERKQVEAIRTRLMEHLESSPDFVGFADANDAHIIYINRAGRVITGIGEDEDVTKLKITDVHPAWTNRMLEEVILPAAVRTGGWQGECAFLHRDGHETPVSMVLRAHKSANGAIDVFSTTSRDITERKRAEALLQHERDFSDRMLDTAQVIILVLNPQGRLVRFNHYMETLTGYSLNEVKGQDWFSTFLPEPEREKTRELFLRALQDIQTRGNISALLTKDGQQRLIEWYDKALKDAQGNTTGLLAIGLDVTERKQGEKDIQHANRALATLSAVNRNLVRATNEDELLQAICDAIVKQRGYRMAWVGYKQHDESKSIRIMAYAGHDEGYLDTMQITWAESERGMGLSGRAIRSGATQLCQDIAHDPLFLPWRDAALQRGYAASIALPLLNGDHTVFGVLHVYSGEVNDFNPGEVALLEEMAGDLAFGVRSLHTRHERDLAMEQSQRHLEKLRNSLEDTVRAMASLVEMRDPYTAGHQARVANLAAAIAGQMGLPDEQAHAIHIAGTVHDLGKINIPAEVLSKPGKITAIEFNLIKTHPQAGYDILQGIDFPWPIAQMVLQHHERPDGSGYPQGLKGEAILLEARILAVADAVEAISAHRPYRPGFGIEIALAEITQQRGNFYDPQVVDACLALFREQHYSFKS